MITHGLTLTDKAGNRFAMMAGLSVVFCGRGGEGQGRAIVERGSVVLMLLSIGSGALLVLLFCLAKHWYGFVDKMRDHSIDCRCQGNSFRRAWTGLTSGSSVSLECVSRSTTTNNCYCAAFRVVI